MSVKMCDVCGVRRAKYICQGCGRSTCEECIEPHNLLCTKCYEKTERSLKSSAETVGEEIFQTFPIKIFFIGFLLIFIGMIIIFLATLLSGLRDSISLFLFIGPIPIILGMGEHALLLTILAIIVTVICITLFVLLSRRKYFSIKGFMASSQQI